MYIKDEQPVIQAQAAEAADYIRKHGWYQGNYYGPNGCVCALGAIRKVTGLNDDCALALLFGRKIGDKYGVPDWNDSPERKESEVLAVFDAIAQGK